MFGVAAIFSKIYTEASALKPIMTNFRVNDSTKDRVYFDTPLGPVTGLDHTKLIITGSRTVTAINTVDNYFTVSSAFDFWDNNTVRQELGNSITYDFTMQHIENNIAEPVIAGNVYYVSTTGSNGAAGTSEGTAWATLTYASSQLVAGDTLYIKAGDYGNDQFLLLASGTSVNPIKVIGYKTVIGDGPLLTRSVGMSFNSTELPQITGNNFDFNANTNIIVKNIQVQPNSASIDAFDLDYAQNVYLYNVYCEEAKNGFWSLQTHMTNNIRLKRVFAQNNASTGIVLPVDHGLIDDAYVCSSYVKNMDYYIVLQGTTLGSASIVKNSYVNRFPTDSHGGHGISLKADEEPDNGFKLEYTLVENLTLVNVSDAPIELRHSEVQYNVLRNVNTEWGGNTDRNYSGIKVTSAQNNIVESCIIEAKYSMHFLGSVEDEEALDAGNNNKFINCIFKGSSGGQAPTIHILNDTDSGTVANRVFNDNEWIHCTFDKASNFLWNNETLAGTGNKLTNCIIHDVPTLQGSGTSIPLTYEYTNFWGGFAQQSGTGNFSVDPVFINTYEPSASLASLEVPNVTNYDLNNKERTKPNTTVGPVTHASEEVIPDIEASALTPIMTNFRVEDSNKDRVYFDTPLGYPEGISAGDFTVTVGSISSVTKVSDSSGYFTVASPYTFWNQAITIRKEAGNSIGCYDFKMQSVYNNIAEPVSSTIKYASIAGGGDGSSAGSPWTYEQAFTNAVAGDEVRLLNGATSGVNLVVGASGNATNPIKFIGYNNSAIDVELTQSQGMSFNSSAMPLLQNSTGQGINLENKQYIIIKNIQIFNYDSYHILGSGASNVLLENIYTDGDGDLLSYGIRFRDELDENITLRRVYVQNHEQFAMQVKGSNLLVEDCWAGSSKLVAGGQDYNITIHGGDGVTNNTNAIVRNSTIHRSFLETNHRGHGVSIESIDAGRAMTYCLTENMTIINVGQSLEARHQDVSNCVYRDIEIYSEVGADQDDAGGISISNGSHDNWFENIYVHRAKYGVQWNGSGEDPTALDMGHDSIFVNCRFDDCGQNLDIGEDSYGSNRKMYGEKFINCTFNGARNNMFLNSSNDIDAGVNEMIGCNITGNANDLSTANETGFTYNYCNFHGNVSYAVPSISNISTIDPNYVNEVEFEPQGLLTIMPRQAGVYYDAFGNERDTTTTIGVYATEIIVPDIIAPLYVSSVVENASPSSLVLTYNETLDATSVPATTDFTVNDGAANAVTNVAISGTDITLTLTNAIDNGDVVVVSYIKGVNPIQDADANESVNLTNESVTNNVAVSITYPSFSNAGAIHAATTAVDLEVPYPTVSADDVMVLCMMQRLDGSNVIPTPTGWNVINKNSSSAGFYSSAVFWKRATGSESGTLNIPNSVINTYGILYSFSGVTTSDPVWEGLVEQPPGESTQTVYSLSNTFSSGDLRLAVMIGIQNNDDDVVNTSTGYTLRDEQNTALGSDCSFVVLDEQIANSSTADGQVTMTIPTARYLSTVGFYLRPQGWIAAPKYDVTRTLTLGAEANGQDSNLQDFSWSNDGMKCYSLGATTDILNSYTCLYPYDLKGVVPLNSVNLNTLGGQTTPTGFLWKKDGTKFISVDYGTKKFHGYSLSTAWDISTMTFDAASTAVASQMYEIISPDTTDYGKILWVCYANTNWYRFDLTTAWDVTTLNTTAVQTVSTGTYKFSNMNYNLDGNQIFCSDENNTRGYYTYDLTTAWDVSTLANIQGPSSGPVGSAQRVGHMIPNMTDMVIMGFGSTSGAELKQYFFGDVSPQYNACSQILERQELGDWSTAACDGFVVANDSADHGDWMIHGVAPTATAGKRLEITVPMDGSSTYTVKIWAKRGSQGVNQSFQQWTGIVETISVAISSTTWTEYSFTVTSNATTGLIRVYAHSSTAAIGDDFYIKSLTMTKN